MESDSAQPTPVRTALPHASRLPPSLIIISLLALGLLPIAGDRYIDLFRADVRELVEPARNLTTEVHVSLALGSAAMRDYLNTRDTIFLQQYYAATAREQAAYDALTPLAARLSPDVQSTFHELRVQETRWHSRVSDLMSRSPRDHALIRRVFADEQLYEGTVNAAARLDYALSQASIRLRQRIERAERIIRIVSLGLATLAAAAGLITWSLGRRVRSYATLLEDRRHDLEQALASRERLTRSITHDLKNPLNAIMGNVQLLSENIDGALNDAQHRRLGNIEKSALSMVNMIDSLLEIERLRAGQLRPHYERVNLRDLVEDTVDSQRAALEAAGLELRLNLNGELGIVETDPERVRRIVQNLLSNAAKYTEEGAVTVQAGPDEAQPDRVVISVQDTGRGIPEDQLERIFEEFSRLETGTIPGSGLGLAVSRRVAEWIGGELTVQSTVGKGSTFSLRLPRTVTANSGKPAKAEGAPPSLTSQR